MPLLFPLPGPARSRRGGRTEMGRRGGAARGATSAAWVRGAAPAACMSGVRVQCGTVHATARGNSVNAEEGAELRPASIERGRRRRTPTWISPKNQRTQTSSIRAAGASPSPLLHAACFASSFQRKLERPSHSPVLAGQTFARVLDRRGGSAALCSLHLDHHVVLQRVFNLRASRRERAERARNRRLA